MGSRWKWSLCGLQNTQGAWSLNLKLYLAEGMSLLPTLGVKMVRIWGFGRGKDGRTC